MIQSDPHGNMRKCRQPYPQIGIADGIAFSCSNVKGMQASLRYILKEVDRTVYNNQIVSENQDLTRWANQGILLLNTALTTEIGKIGVHYDIWKPFTAYLLDWLNNYNSGLVYVYMGKKAEEWSDLTNDNNYKFVVSHPASAGYGKLQSWDSKDVFNQVSKIVEANNNYKIIW